MPGVRFSSYRNTVVLNSTVAKSNKIIKRCNIQREEEKASENRQRKREAEEADKFEITPGVTTVSSKRLRVALIGPTQGLPKRRRLCR